MKKLLALEDQLIRVETWLLVFLVLVTLAMAVYGVFYRNVLVPVQKTLATSGPPVAPAPIQPQKKPQGDTPDKGSEEGSGGFGGGFGSDDGGGDDSGGFGGGFGSDDGADAKKEDDNAGGFGGGFGSDDAEETPTPEPKEAPKEEEAGGFGGGFGSDDGGEDKKEDDSGGFGGGFGSDEGDSGGFGGGFGSDDGDTAKKDPAKKAAPVAKAPEAPKEPQGGPPAEGSFAHWLIGFIDMIKVEWIDIILRQFVVLVGFFGAMLATRRRKHINIDAASKLLPEHAQRGVAVLVNLLSVVICVLLAIAGGKLVALGLEAPTELTHWSDEWVFQTMFPMGFGLLAFHFMVRLAQSIIVFRDRLPLEPHAGLEGEIKKIPLPTSPDDDPPEPEPDPEPEPEPAPETKKPASKPAAKASKSSGGGKKGKKGKKNSKKRRR